MRLCLIVGGQHNDASSSSVEDFVAKANAQNLGWHVQDGALYTKFFECECPMLEAVGATPHLHVVLLYSRLWETPV